jgi:hypothetical protein
MDNKSVRLQFFESEGAGWGRAGLDRRVDSMLIAAQGRQCPSRRQGEIIGLVTCQNPIVQACSDRKLD